MISHFQGATVPVERRAMVATNSLRARVAIGSTPPGKNILNLNILQYLDASV